MPDSKTPPATTDCIMLISQLFALAADPTLLMIS